MRIMKKMKVVVGAAISWIFSALSVSMAYAQNVGTAPQASISTVADIFCIIDAGFNVLFWILIAVASIMVIVAAYGYVTAGGEAEKVSKATKTIMYAAIAVAVALLAKGIPSIIGSFFGVSGLGQSQCANSMIF
jgi:hypothetical protein